MASIKTTVPAWNNHLTETAVRTQNSDTGLWTKYLAFLDGQRANKMLWFFVALTVHATVFLPVPLFLIGYLNAPVFILVITMVSFFSNLVANMGGAGIRVTISMFLVSILIHLVMVTLILL